MLFVGSRNLVLMNLNISCDYLHGQSLVIILDPEIKKYFGFRGVRFLQLLPQLLHLSNASRSATTRLDDFLRSIEPQPVLLKGRVSARRRSRSQVILVKSDRQRRVGGEDELGITLAPVPVSG